MNVNEHFLGNKRRKVPCFKIEGYWMANTMRRRGLWEFDLNGKSARFYRPHGTMRPDAVRVIKGPFTKYNNIGASSCSDQHQSKLITTKNKIANCGILIDAGHRQIKNPPARSSGPKKFEEKSSRWSNDAKSSPLGSWLLSTSIWPCHNHYSIWVEWASVVWRSTST